VAERIAFVPDADLFQAIQERQGLRCHGEIDRFTEKAFC